RWQPDYSRVVVNRPSQKAAGQRHVNGIRLLPARILRQSFLTQRKGRSDQFLLARFKASVVGFLQAANLRVTMVCEDDSIAWPDYKAYLHASGVRGGQLFRHVRQKQDLLGRNPDRLRNATIAIGLDLRSSARVEIPLQEDREIARRGVAEEKLLCQDAARGKDPHRKSPFVPALERRTHVRKPLPHELSMSIAVRPDLSLQLFERGGLPIAIHEPFNKGNNRGHPRGLRFINPGRDGLAVTERRGVLIAKAYEQRLVVGDADSRLEVGSQVRSRVGEKHVFYEHERSS